VKNMDGPADTRMMGIVHDALRRDLARIRAALAGAVPEAGRRPLAAHVAWMMDFLHAHHEGEDAGLYPMVRAANPAAATLLDAMGADHAAIDPAVEGLRAAAARWAAAGTDSDRTALLDALVALEAVLLPPSTRRRRRGRERKSRGNSVVRARGQRRWESNQLSVRCIASAAVSGSSSKRWPPSPE
jgi:AcrR family transcriptional regulator